MNFIIPYNSNNNDNNNNDTNILLHHILFLPFFIQVVSKLWVYIKARGLQDPADKRNINLDAAMTEVFGTDKLTMFSLNKVLTPHLTAPLSSIAKIEGGVGCDMKSNGEGGSNEGEGEGEAGEDEEGEGEEGDDEDGDVEENAEDEDGEGEDEEDGDDEDQE